MTNSQLLKKLKLDYVNGDISDESFPYEKPSKKIEIIDFKRTISPEDAIKELAEQGLRPATMTELLTYAPEYFKKKRDYYVVALGSVWRDPLGYRYVPCLWSDASERCLDLNWAEVDWDSNYRFACLRNSALKPSDFLSGFKSLPFDPSDFERRISELEKWKERITNA